MRQANADYFNPDEVARRLLKADPSLDQAGANAAAWQEGKRLLEKSIAERKHYAFETTLGGNTMTGLLQKALDEGVEVCIWYAGLDSPERHIARVAGRVARGGHDIPEADIRKRYRQSHRNLVSLIPRLTILRVFDNSAEADPKDGKPPEPRLLLHLERGRLVHPTDPKLLTHTPEWARPIAGAALKVHVGEA